MIPYPFRLAAQSILHEKWINLLSILTISACLLITTFVALFVYNADALTKKLPEKFSMMLYLKDNLSSKEVEDIINKIRKEGAVETVKYISKDEALKELKTDLKDASYILEGLEGNPLQDSIEIKLKKDILGPESVKNLSTKINAIDGVDEVEYGEKFLSTIHSIKAGVRTLGIIFIAIMFSGVIFICYSTVKILFYRKKEEIETYKLIGATKGFIRAPFIIEGTAIGLSGGLLSLICILSLYYMVFLKLSISLSLFKSIVFPTEITFILPLTGFFLGITGA
ncbi:MAG: ABC transporter permease, partial [Nitrospirae bacterium]|nr:ABC transporter permease [Nitrospirota bacterium]